MEGGSRERAWGLSELPQPLEIASLPIVCNQYSNLFSLQMVGKPLEKPWPNKIHTICPYDLGIVFSEAMDYGGLTIPDCSLMWLDIFVEYIPLPPNI